MANRRQQVQKKSDPPSAAVDGRVAGERDIASENLLIFRIAGELFGLRLATVAEIIRLPDLAHMPLVPPSLLGLANLRGIVLPVVSMRALLHLPDLDANEQIRVVVLRGDAPVGFVVDRIERLMLVAAAQLEPRQCRRRCDRSGAVGWRDQRRRRREHDQNIEPIASSGRAIRPARRLRNAPSKPAVGRND